MHTIGKIIAENLSRLIPCIDTLRVLTGIPTNFSMNIAKDVRMGMGVNIAMDGKNACFILTLTKRLRVLKFLNVTKVQIVHTSTLNWIEDART